jgi:hypothetical protein
VTASRRQPQRRGARQGTAAAAAAQSRASQRWQQRKAGHRDPWPAAASAERPAAASHGQALARPGADLAGQATKSMFVHGF